MFKCIDNRFTSRLSTVDSIVWIRIAHSFSIFFLSFSSISVLCVLFRYVFPLYFYFNSLHCVYIMITLLCIKTTGPLHITKAPSSLLETYTQAKTYKEWININTWILFMQKKTKINCFLCPLPHTENFTWKFFLFIFLFYFFFWIE